MDTLSYYNRNDLSVIALVLLGLFQRPKQESGCLLSNICTTCAEMKMIDNKDECQRESSEVKACIKKHMPECKHILGE